MRPLYYLVLIACLLGWPAAAALAQEPEAPAPADTPPAQAQAVARVESLVSGFLHGSTSQYQQLSKLIKTKYPHLAQELVQFITTEEPNLLAELLPLLTPMIKEKYPEVPAIISQVIGQNDQLNLRVSQLVNDKYASFLADLAALPGGPQHGEQAAQMVSSKYTDLLTDLMDLLHRDFPETLNQVRDRVQARYSKIIGDCAGLTARKFPHLTAKALNFVVNHYPQLLPELIAILYSNPPAPTAANADAQPPAAGATTAGEDQG